jgi:hypothetical protein
MTEFADKTGLKVRLVYYPPYQCELGVESQSTFFRVQLPVKHHLDRRLEHRKKKWIGRNVL